MLKAKMYECRRKFFAPGRIMLAAHQSEFISVAKAFESGNTKSKNNGQEKAFDRSTKHVATGNVGFKV